MTSDAKIGLLLGLVFIFVIAVLINGLPSFKGHDSNNDLTMNTVGSKNNSLGIADNERKVSKQFIDQEIRLNAPLPQGSAVSTVGEKPGLIESAPGTDAAPATATQTSGESVVQPESAVAGNTTDESLKEVAGQLESASAENPTVRTIEASSVEPVSQKTYVVSKGDSLATIALKVYGTVDGKKQSNITKIFKANSAVLKSPERISIGQKLVIPPLSSLGTVSKNNSEASSAKINKLKSSSSNVAASDNTAKQTKAYVVKQGDSLWTIAKEKLGNGSRYTEILELNKDVLADESSLTVGMGLKLPER
jgi:nucleoid-associated protein YgaU